MFLLYTLFPLLGFFIMLGISMMLIGILQRRDPEPLRALQMAAVILWPFLLVQLITFASRAEYIDYSPTYHVVLAYFFIPLLILGFWHKKPLSHSALYGLIVLLASICSSVVLGFLAHNVILT